MLEASKILSEIKLQTHYVKIFESKIDEESLFMLVVDNESFSNRTDFAYFGKVSLLQTHKPSYIPKGKTKLSKSKEYL